MIAAGWGEDRGRDFLQRETTPTGRLEGAAPSSKVITVCLL